MASITPISAPFLQFHISVVELAILVIDQFDLGYFSITAYAVAIDNDSFDSGPDGSSITLCLQVDPSYTK